MKSLTTLQYYRRKEQRKEKQYGHCIVTRSKKNLVNTFAKF